MAPLLFHYPKVKNIFVTFNFLLRDRIVCQSFMAIIIIQRSIVHSLYLPFNKQNTGYHLVYEYFFWSKFPANQDLDLSGIAYLSDCFQSVQSFCIQGNVTVEKVLHALIWLVWFWKRLNKSPLHNSIVYLYISENGFRTAVITERCLFREAI